VNNRGKLLQQELEKVERTWGPLAQSAMVSSKSLVICQHRLDPEVAKAYSADLCDTKTLRNAAREQIESFVESLTDWARKDLNALLCQLNWYLDQSRP
jgi:hypothetical protein